MKVNFLFLFFTFIFILSLCSISIYSVSAAEDVYTIKWVIPGDVAPKLTVWNPYNTTYYSTILDLEAYAEDDDGIANYTYTLNDGAETLFTPNSTIFTHGFVIYQNITICATDNNGNKNCTFRMPFVTFEETPETDPKWTDNKSNIEDCPEGYYIYGFEGDMSPRCAPVNGSVPNVTTTCAILEFGYYNPYVPQIQICST